VARRAWARNHPSIETCIHYNKLRKDSDHITLPYLAEERMVAGLVAKAFAQRGREK
jgi:urocanate hydratase